MIAKTEDLGIRPAVNGMGGAKMGADERREGLADAVRGMHGVCLVINFVAMLPFPFPFLPSSRDLSFSPPLRVRMVVLKFLSSDFVLVNFIVYLHYS